jgi:hypothetical protein
MYIYTETGILVDRVSYADLAHKYGKPVEISENGLILIFRKGVDNPEIHLIMVHINKLEWVSTINIRDRISDFLLDRPDYLSYANYTEMNEFYNK